MNTFFLYFVFVFCVDADTIVVILILSRVRLFSPHLWFKIGYVMSISRAVQLVL